MRGELATDQSQRNLAEADRAMALDPLNDYALVRQHLAVGALDEAIKVAQELPLTVTALCPHPKFIVIAEIINAKRYA